MAGQRPQLMLESKCPQPVWEGVGIDQHTLIDSPQKAHSWRIYTFALCSGMCCNDLPSQLC